MIFLLEYIPTKFLLYLPALQLGKCACPHVISSFILFSQVMFKYVDLAVDMKQGRKVKDALINYRNTCQQINVGSLEEVVKYLVDVASERAEAARKEAQSMLDDVGDLEAEASPEEMILSYVSGEKSADRTDREVVTPWFKFLWETHRNVLDVVRNNSRLEALYATAANRAFAFCQQYKRTTEFRRLCDILRNHLATLIKYKDQAGRDRTDLSVPATWEIYVEMRFSQLRTACELELWAEAFRSVEDIQGLIAMAPKGIKGPKASLMATYYARLTQIFTRSEARLYNAYAWYRLFIFSKSYNKGLSKGDVAAMASNVVLSALSVPPYDSAAAAGARGEEARVNEQERANKMAAILGYSVDRRDNKALLSRAELLADVERKGLLQLVPPGIKAIYTALEGEFNPLQLCKALVPLLEALPALGESLAPTAACPAGPSAAALEAYVPFLQQVALVRTVRQLSEVYSVMHVSALSELAPFGWTFGQSEALIIEAVRHGYLQARFDHRNGTVHFGGQELENERVRSHISVAAKRLSKALLLINPKESKAESEARRVAAIRRALESAGDENKRALARKLLIEKKKEDAERVMMEREVELEKQRAAAEALAREAEERRQAAERVRREEERIRKEMEEEEQSRLRAELAARGKKIGEGEVVDMQAMKAELQREEDVKAGEMRRKLAKLAKHMDHLERAKREEEAPLRAEEAVKRLKDEEEAWAADQAAAKVAHRAAWERDIDLKARMAKMEAEAAAFGAAVQERRAAEFEALRRERERAREEAREVRREERDMARKREYVRRCRVELEEKRRAEEEERKKEEDEKRAREAAERQRKLDEIAEKQRQREAEIEAKARGERESGARPSAAEPAAPAAAAPAATAAQSASQKAGYVPPHLRRSTGGGGGGGAPREDRDRGGAAWRPGGAQKRDVSDEREAAPGADRAAGGGWGRREERDREPERERERPAGSYRPPAAGRAPSSRW